MPHHVYSSRYVLKLEKQNKQGPGVKQSACSQFVSARRWMHQMGNKCRTLIDVVVFALRVKGTSSLLLHKGLVDYNIHSNHIFMDFLWCQRTFRGVVVLLG